MTGNWTRAFIWFNRVFKIFGFVVMIVFEISNKSVNIIYSCPKTKVKNQSEL